MVIIVKKYLFLFVLFLVYVILKTKLQVMPVLSYKDKFDQDVLEVTLNFTNGINSESLKNIFSNYNDEVFFHSIKTMNSSLEISSSNIDDVINMVYEQEDELFYISHITSGFKIEEITLLAYKDEIIPFLDENDLIYTLK